METKYVKPRSMSWWAGVAMVAMGFLVGLSEAVDLRGWEAVIAAWTGGVPANVLLLNGASVIGIRGAFDK